MLQRETVVAAEVNCQHLAMVVDSQTQRHPLHAVLPYFEGVTLRRLVQWRAQRGGAAPVRFCLSVVRQIAAAVKAMHTSGWLHGQVWPEHVIISPRGHATLIDLTQARRLGSAECRADASGETWPIYAAPEMFSAGRQLTGAADVYSLGVLLFELLVGHPPFDGSPGEVAALHRLTRPPELRRWRSDTSTAMSELVWRMLAKEPLRRPSGEQVVRWLAELEIEEFAI